MRLRLDLDRETSAALMEAASADLRPVTMHAQVILRRSLGLPVPTNAKTPAVVAAEAPQSVP